MERNARAVEGTLSPPSRPIVAALNAEDSRNAGSRRAVSVRRKLPCAGSSLPLPLCLRGARTRRSIAPRRPGRGRVRPWPSTSTATPTSRKGRRGRPSGAPRPTARPRAMSRSAWGRPAELRYSAARRTEPASTPIAAIPACSSARSRPERPAALHGTAVLHRQHAPDLVGLEADGHGAAHAGEDGDVVELLHQAAHLQPMHDVAAPDVDDEQGGARLHLVALQVLVEGEAAEGAVLARARQADHREPVDQRQAAQIARAEDE